MAAQDAMLVWVIPVSSRSLNVLDPFLMQCRVLRELKKACSVSILREQLAGTHFFNIVDSLASLGTNFSFHAMAPCDVTLTLRPNDIIFP